MTIDQVGLFNFRLFSNRSFDLRPGINLIKGKNGSGKSSLLEALNIAYGGGSFRTSNLVNCINSQDSSFNISITEKLSTGDLKSEVFKHQDKRVVFTKLFNKVKTKNSFNKLVPVIINDKSFGLIEGEPVLRRDFLNNLLFHVKPEAKKNFNLFIKSLKQRNRCLKDAMENNTLDLWTRAVILHGVIHSQEQYKLFAKFKELLEKRVNLVSKENNLSFLEGFSVTYLSGWGKGKSLKDELVLCLKKDKITGRTSFGPHRADLVFRINKKLATNILSRGQLKLLIILIFLSFQSFIKENANLGSLLMIDDLGSELDINNLKIALNQILINKYQALITSTGSDWAQRLEGESFNINKISL